MTYVEFWDVGARVPGLIPMNLNDISGHLMTDWVPGLPTSANSPLMGWPSYMLQSANFGRDDVLVLREEAGRTERQWKGMLSWMLGIAGARHILCKERYRWIAPLSAFYPDTVHSVSHQAFPAAYPPSSISALSEPDNSSHLRPDYLALRRTGSTYDWAIVEAKGTKSSLENRWKCPVDWYEQARNVILKVHGYPVNPPRYLVIATRVNPNAVNELTRRLQIRAWNSTDNSIDTVIPTDAAVDIVSAHLYGFFRNLGLINNAHAIALSREMRSEVGLSDDQELSRRLIVASELAELEMQQHRIDNRQVTGQSAIIVYIEINNVRVEFEISEPIADLARGLRSATQYALAVNALRDADSRLDDWEQQARLEDRNDVILPFGVRVLLPEEFRQAF